MIRGARPVVVIFGLLTLILLLPPLLGAGVEVLQTEDSASPAEMGFRGPQVATRTILWSVSTALLATLLGWWPGRRLASNPTGWMTWAALIPMALPAALLFDAWWLQVGPQSWIGAMAARGDQVPLLRGVVLAITLVCWGWPITSLLLMARRAPGSERLLANLDGVGLPRRFGHALRSDAGTLGLGWLLTSVFIATNTVCFDLAQVASWGFELRALDARGASAGTVLKAGFPAMMLCILVVVVMVLFLRRRSNWGRSPQWKSTDASWLVPLLFTAVPLGLLAWRGFRAFDPDSLMVVHGPAIANTLLLALACAGVSVVIALGVTMARLAGTGSSRLAVVCTALFAVAAMAPATLVAIGLESAWNRPGFHGVYGSFMILVLGVGVRIGVVAALIGLVAGATARRGLPLVLMDAPVGTRLFMMATRPVLLRASLAAAALGGVLGMGEIAMVSRIQPPGIPLVASALLNAMHYQYLDTIIPVVLLMVSGAMLAAAFVPRILLRRLAPLAVGIFLLHATPGCSPPTDAMDPEPVAVELTFGGAGAIPGRFDYPRAIAIDKERGEVVVIDKTARVQRFDMDGRFIGGWRMPKWENGKPTGVAVADDGRIFVADTHYHRIAVFNTEGKELFAFGSYGEEPGEFIYPTDVAFGPEGTLFVAEYGGNDRIQVFDSKGRFLREFGSMGDGIDQFSRPQGIAWDAEAGELFIADAINHRIVVTDQFGTVVRVLGAAGRAAGRFSYPYDLALLGDGSIVVVEFGNNRIQRVDTGDGSCLGLWGGTGREEGRLRYPWGIDAGGGVLAVLDSGNSRVFLGETP